MLRRASSPEFVGRTAELRDLEGALARAREGTSSAALIGGESGVGKTRLVDELVARADGVRFLVGECVHLGEGELPYAPIVAALRQLRHALGEDELEQVLGGARAELAPLVPELAGERDEAAGRGAAPQQALLFEQILGVLGRLAERAPLVLVVEDLHWADRSTREFLAFLLRNARHERLLVVGTYRTEELHRRHPLRPLLAETERAAHVERIVLAPFSRAELTAQLAGILGERPESSLVEELFARAEGNPFFTEELLAATDGDPKRRLPDSIRDALLLRVETLAEPTQQVLRVAAAAGLRVSHGLLAAACPGPDGELLAGLREALAHNVLRQDESGAAYAFRHALLREVLYDDLLPGERGPLHRTLAVALRDDASLSVASGGAGAELAFHWFAAHDLPEALAASLRAGADAERVSAFAEASAHFERALEVWDGVPETARPPGVAVVEVLRRAAEAAHIGGDSARAAALARRALAQIDADAEPATAALIEERIGLYLFLAGQVPEALASYRSAVARLPADEPTPERAVLLAAEGHTLLLSGRPQEAVQRCEEALAIVAEVGPAELEGPILATLAPAALSIGKSEDESLAQLRRARELAEAAGDHQLLIRAQINFSEILDQIGRTAEGAEVAREAIAQTPGARHGLGVLAGDGATRLLKLGRWDEAEAFLDEAAVPLAGFGSSALLEARAVMALMRGEYDRADALLQDADRMLGDARGTMWLGPVGIARAEAELWRGDPETAVTRLGPALAEAQEDELLFYVAPVWAIAARAHADIAVAARGVRETERAAAAAAAAAGLAEQLQARLDVPFVAPEVERHALVCALEAARAAGDDDPDGWARAAVRWEELDRPYQAAYARWREAEAALVRDEDRPRAQRALAGAVEVARRLRAMPLLAEVETLAQRARLRLVPAADAPQPPASTSTAERIGLTPRELEVLRLVATGRTNKEIGDELYLSHKTVSVHVSRILTKLDVRGRIEAASLAHRLGLTDRVAE
jgi:DNA-binding CsgD family transcriptional regulator/tetratricopeptide (TPR) repeat protein